MIPTVAPLALRLRKHSNGLLVHLVLAVISVVTVMPLFIALTTSLAPVREVMRYPPHLFPSYLEWKNYVDAWYTYPFGRFLVNSVVQSGLIMVGQVVLSIMAAYAFAVMRFAGRDLLFYVVVGTLMIPGELVIIPNFIRVSEIGWANTYWGLSVPFMASAFGTFLLRQFFLTVPQDLHDAAQIDGCGHWRYLWTIMVPLSRAGIGAFAIFSFLNAWNMYLWPLLITNKLDMRTIQIGIAMFMNQEAGQNWAIVMAGTVIALMPTIIAFFVAQKQLVRGIALTGLKG